ncbi:claspin-like isoform X2 [Copidosoma floridanum]|uniref:claspin-like isoform X2 n=1 Tax=Copidosoma floridanum TaxID=29053 RepID=UPI000C6F9E32|nr:claspin-like isoform X2 [Copidosoma floridanum]
MELNSEIVVATASTCNVNGDSLLSKDCTSPDGCPIRSNSDSDSEIVQEISEKHSRIEKEILSIGEDNGRLPQSQGKSSQDSKTDSCSSTQSSSTCTSQKTETGPSLQGNNDVDDNKSSSSGSTLKESQNSNGDDEDSLSSSTTVKNSQPVDDDENNSKSSESLSTRTLPVTNSNRSTLEGSQNTNTQLTEDNDSRSSFTSSNTKSTIQHNQTLSDKLQEDENSRSSFQSSGRKSPLEKQSRSPCNDFTEDNDSRNSKPKKYLSIVDSDSEDEIVVPKKSFGGFVSDSDSVTHEKSNKKSKQKNKKQLFDSSDSEDDKKSKNNGIKKVVDKSINKSNQFNDLIDSESESDKDNQSDRRGGASSGEENSTEKSKRGKKKSEKKRVGSIRASKDAAMQQIHSETQRLIRESQVSLPYHRPKQRTLQEFLNRKKISGIIPQNLTCAEKVRMLSAVVSKVVQAKEKEAEEFYKSSDSEEEEEKSDKPLVKELDQTDRKIDNKSESTIDGEDMILEPINISNGQNPIQDRVQDSHENKLSTLQQRLSDSGVPRKLFLDDDIDSESSTKTETLPNENNNLELKDADAVKKIEESKTETKESCTSHEITADHVEAMEVCNDRRETDISILDKPNLESTKSIVDPDEKEKAAENKNEHENSTEDFVLQMPDETEPNVDEKPNDSNKNEKPSESKDQDTVVETVKVDNRDESASDKSVALTSENPIEKQKLNNKTSTEETEEMVLEFPKDTNNEDDIIDKNALSDKLYKPPEFDDLEEKPSFKKIILANALKSKPMIKALPGSMIDFTSIDQISEGVTKLVDRFTRHSAVHKHNANNVVEVKVMRTEGVDNDISIVEEMLPFNKTLTEDDCTKEGKPGEKLKILKEDLKRKISSVKNEEWKHKEENEKENEEEEGNGKDDDFYAGLPDDDEEFDDEESAESELEEDDMPIVEKKRPKCEFGDEEAEESVDEDEEENEDEEEEKEENEDEDEEDEDEEEESEKEEEEETNKSPKKLKRIIKPFDEEDSNDSDTSLNNKATEAKNLLERTKMDQDIFLSQIKSNFVVEDLVEDSSPAFIRDRLDADASSQTCKTPLPKSNLILSMISPVTHLTALNSYNDSAKKSDAKTPNFNLGNISTDSTPFENSGRPSNNFSLEKMMSLQKKLFEDPPDPVHDNELLEICSGNFDDTQNTTEPALRFDKQNEVTDSQIMDICSGSFVSQSTFLQPCDETSQDMALILDPEEESIKSPIKNTSLKKTSDESMSNNDSESSRKSAAAKSPLKSTVKSVFKSKNPMDAWLMQTQQKHLNEVTDSQLLDICSGAFVSQAADPKDLESEVSQVHKSDTLQDLFESTSQKKPNQPESSKEKITEEEEPKAPWTSFRIASSSDEENEKSENQKKRMKKKKLKKKKVQKLELSDDEDEERNEYSDLEEESEFEEEEEDEEEKYFDYDSDENEVIVIPKKEIKKVAGKFLDKEAELSESEWGSDDEDERDLDKLEYEEGDAEDIDEAQVKHQLDKLHMKQVLDDDQREVRMLQELLFDDGDLHSEGAGRERKFRWRNVDSLGDDDNVGSKLEDNIENFDDEVDASMEVQMRKLRYEQQKFLEENEQKIVETIEDDFADSEFMKSSLKVVSVRSSKTSVTEQKMTKTSDVDKTVTTSDMIKVVSNKSIKTKNSFSFSNPRGSFLARGEAALHRIAQNLPQSNMPVISNRKKNFVFEHISPKVANPPVDSEQENDTPAKDSNKRKRKIIPSQQTPTTSKKPKINDKKPGKKLF